MTEEDEKVRHKPPFKLIKAGFNLYWSGKQSPNSIYNVAKINNWSHKQSLHLTESKSEETEHFHFLPTTLMICHL